MTVDEIFSSESEHLYFRLIAARNALNAAGDSETEQVLNDILDETLNNISRIGTDEEIAAAEEIVVRKSNKTVKEYLNSQKFMMIAKIIMGVTALAAVLSLVMIIIASDQKVKPIISVVLIAAAIIGASWFVYSYMKKKMEAARSALKGKTVIGCKIDNGTKTAEISSGKRETKVKDRASSPKVVRNFGGVIKAVLIIAVLAVAAFLVYTNRTKIVDSAKIIMYNIGLSNPAPDYSVEKYKEINAKLVSVKNGVYYDHAQKLFSEKNYTEACAMFEKCIGFRDSEARLAETRNYEYYSLAEKELPTSMLQALIYLKKITLPFKNAEGRLKNYATHVEYIAVYGKGDNKFNLKDFAVKDYSLYIYEERMGYKKVASSCDREGYAYKVVEREGENGVTWYIASDHVLKVTPEEETVFRK